MHQRVYSLLWLLGTILVFLAGCKTSESAAVKNEHSLLWKIEGKNLKRPSYVLGTIHLLPQKDFFLSESMKLALANTQQVVLELDMDDPTMGMNMLQNASMSEGNTLNKLLSEGDYQQLDAIFKKSTGVGIEAFNKWQPMLVASVVMQQMMDTQIASYELTLVRLAQEAQKEVKGLESIQEQTEAMATIPYTQQAKYLSELLNDVDKQKTLFGKMVELYKSQNINALLDYIVTQSGGIDFSTVLLNERNQKWVPRIALHAAEKPTFFAVGAGHLPGKDGVLALLRKAGYRVTAVL
ncbi:MAG: TraB/GumN family protein [Haliscomenobacter sp.]|uniref:TraB/GumN family protein n=1 Tax=Haliscomenobacter sp. TaxID=2717303 RepID=UPI0029BF0BCE|nr:TraB/GumN family protein [Haliscomenobacter sp.]MDX2069017.1 TraB/GumN family protein [Haliscomenobacter sp.]